MIYHGFVCASLPDQKKRRISFSKSFKDPAHYKFVESVDGRLWAEIDADKYVDEEMKALRDRERNRGKAWVNEAAIACALTHRDRLLHEAKERDCFLCEDDVLINEDFIEAWENPEARSLVKRLRGVVLAHYFSNQAVLVDANKVASIGRYGIYRFCGKKVYSAACYYIPSNISDYLVDLQTPVKYTADSWDEITRDLDWDIYLIYPSPAFLGGFASTIGYGKRSVKSNAKVFQILRLLRRRLSKNRYENSVVFTDSSSLKSR